VASLVDNLGAVERAQEAAQSGLEAQLVASEAAVLARLVRAHRDGKLTDRDAAVGIALISELRAATDKTRRTILRGVEAGHAITTGTQ
jgi:hypothetical protein